MKKIISFILIAILLVGCTYLSNTPIKKTEDFLRKYQTLNQDVLDDLNTVVAEEELFNAAQRDKYIAIMKKQYQNLSYEIKDDIIDGNDAIVKVEITVYDFTKVLNEASIYLETNITEFYNEENQIRIEFSISEGKMIDKLKTLVYNYKSIFSFKMVATNPHGIESCFILVVKRLTDQKINDFFIELMKIII